MYRILRTATVFAFLAASAFAADITGQWSATIVHDDKSKSEMIFRFKQLGERLTGAVKVGYFFLPFEKGQVKNGEVIFDLPIEHDTGATLWQFRGNLMGNTIQFRRSEKGKGYVQHIVAKKVG